MEEQKKDMVNHPSHYNTGKYECIDVMEEIYGPEITMGFCIGNAFKYLYRCGSKHDTPVEDIEKSKWYLDKYLELYKIYKVVGTIKPDSESSIAIDMDR